MTFRFASAAALAACAAMAAAPVAAADLPTNRSTGFGDAPSVFSGEAVTAHQYRHYRRHRTDAGDVIGAVVAIGAIAAVASAIGKANTGYRDRDYRYPERYPYPDRRYDYRPRMPDARYDDSRGIDRAADMCVREIERNARVASVDGVIRNSSGWAVSGQLGTGEPFTCSIGQDGRIDRIDYTGPRAAVDRQWDDARYAAARAAHDGAVVSPAYPGAPFGDPSARPVYEAGDADDYEYAEAPDFSG